MAAKGWTYDQTAKRYRAADGKFLSHASLVKARDQAIDRMTAQARSLGSEAATGLLSPAGFETAMRALVKQSYGLQYMLGKGGRNAMTKSDWGKVGNAVKKQYKYLANFRAELASADPPTEGQATARAGLYTDSSVQAFARGQGAAWGVTLPGHPGDGLTACLGNCRCSWELESSGGTLTSATWTLGGADPCDGCQARAAKWNPWTPPAVEARQPWSPPDDFLPLTRLT